MRVDNSWLELSPDRAVLAHSPNTITVDEDGINAKTSGPPHLLLDNSTADGLVELTSKKVRLRFDGEGLHLTDPELTDGVRMRAIGYVPEWDGNPPPRSGHPDASFDTVRAAEGNTLNLYSRRYYAEMQGADGDGAFEAGPHHGRGW